jgi:hypothetical protein
MSKEQGHDHLLAEFSVLVKQLAQDVSVQAIKPELNKAAVSSQEALKESTQKLSRELKELSRQLAEQHKNEMEAHAKYKNNTIVISTLVIAMLIILIVKSFF